MHEIIKHFWQIPVSIYFFSKAASWSILLTGLTNIRRRFRPEKNMYVCGYPTVPAKKCRP